MESDSDETLSGSEPNRGGVANIQYNSINIYSPTLSM